jgi:hypothetical protein
MNDPESKDCSVSSSLEKKFLLAICFLYAKPCRIMEIK